MNRDSLELLEEISHVLKACEVYIRLTDDNTPGRRRVLGEIEAFKKMVDNNFNREL